jgi:hypothetical protein
MAQPTSGTTNFNPSLGDLTIDAFSRCQVRPPQITADHMYQARVSAQLLFSEWSNRQVNLFNVQLLSFALVPGVPSYALPNNVVTVLDCYVRQFQLGGPINQIPAFATQSGQAAVTVTLANHGLSAGYWVSVIIPVSVGGLVIQGQYQAATIIDANNFTITAAMPAAGTATGGQVPAFTTIAGSSQVSVNLAAHGLSPQGIFAVQVPLYIGGITLSGGYTILSVTDANNFVIDGVNTAGAAQSLVLENGANCQIATQATGNTPLDFYLYPISRMEYAAQPSKTTQARPTTFWFDRIIPPQLTFWQTPDANGPYTLFYYAVVQQQDAVMANGVTLALPYRFYEAYASGLAARLARKYAPALAAELKAEARQMWEEAAQQDVEQTPLYIFPGAQSYFR